MSDTVDTGLDARISIQEVEGGETAVLTLLESHLNYASADEMKVLLKQTVGKLAEEGRKRFVINIGNVGVLDSSGLAVLISLKKKADSEGLSLAICHMSTMIRRLFELTGLHRAFDLFETEEEAIAGG
jgi:anti-anti-sigma factor